MSLVDRWNSKISSSDVVIHLGDFAFGHQGKACSILPLLNGTKILVPGNHDDKNMKSSHFRSFWSCISPTLLEIPLGELYFVLCHFPIESWNHMYHGSIHLHGHCHSNREHGLKPKQIRNRLDVGVDYHDLFPISIKEVLEEITVHNSQLDATSVETLF